LTQVIFRLAVLIKTETQTDPSIQDDNMKPTTTWILIADGARARIFANLGPGKGIAPVEGGVLKGDHAPSRDLASDRPGRTFESADVMRHAIDPAQDPHRELKRAFAGRIASLIEERLAENAFDRLVLVAPPVTLGDLRSALSKSVKERVSAELDNDLTNTPIEELPKHLAAILTV
jgi:protein required for attachment to host cells